MSREFKKAEYPVHQLIRLGRLEIHFQIPTSMSESSVIVIVLPSLVYPYFKLEIEQDETCKPLIIKQETEWIEWFCTSLVIPSILE